MMRKIIFAFCCLMFSNLVQAQFTPDYSKNFWTQTQVWDEYFQSRTKSKSMEQKEAFEDVGYMKYMHWKNFWKEYMPESGDFKDANEVYRLLQDHQQNDENANQNGLRVNTSWTEIGPTQFSNVHRYYSAIPIWWNPQANGSQIWPFEGSIGRFDRLYRHPGTYLANTTTLFACSGNYENAGGGLFISTNNGTNWTVAGTDLIPHPQVMCLGIKPSSATYLPGIEVWLTGLASGSVYRSMDYGNTWKRINNYVPNVTGIETMTDANNNITYDSYTHNIIYIPDATNQYGVAVVAGFNGLYYSTNYASLNPALVTWNKFALTMPPIMDGGDPTKTLYTVTDVEYYTKNGFNSIVANIVKLERTSTGIPLSYRNYVMISNYTPGNPSAVNLQVLGPIGIPPSPNSIFNANPNLALQKFHSSNIEVKSTNPNYIYISYLSFSCSTQVIYRYDLLNNLWLNMDATGLSNMPSAVWNEPHGFAIDPTNDNLYYVISTEERKYNNGTIVTSHIPGYSTNKHADTRDVLVENTTNPPTLWIGTDGGIYKNSDDLLTYTPKSEGLNTTQFDIVSLGQKPPFNVSGGAWHGGCKMYDPVSGIWHVWPHGDGDYSHTTFLNPNKVYFWNQLSQIRAVSSGHPSTSIALLSWYTSEITTSENIPGLAFGSNYPTLRRSFDDFLTQSSINVPAYNSPPNPTRYGSPHVLINEPGRLAIVDCYNPAISEVGAPVPDRVVFINNVSSPTPTIDLIVNINSITNTNNFTSSADIDGGLPIVFDALVPKKFVMVYRGYPIVGSPDTHNRIVEYDPISGTFTDLTYYIENNPDFPAYISIWSIEQDRQTGIIYIGTSNGVYYLDESVPNKVWRNYSTNIPYFHTNLAINHCQGEIYAATSYRGMWKAPLMRTGVATQEWHINQTATWSERRNLFCTLVVDAGVTLTIEDDLVVYGNQSIVVKKGGILILDGGKITTECGDMWNGVFVEGTYNLGQNVPGAQGKMIIQNNATIEHSHNGVANYGLDANGNVDWTKTGGIIDASNSNFFNNRRAVEFQAYGTGLSNSKFTTCLFQTNQLLNDQVTYPNNNGIEGFVTINAVNGIYFEGNTFKQTHFTGSVGANYGKGIVANESVFTVKENSSSVGNTFYNLFRGIEFTRTSATSGTILIENNTFDNNRVGIHGMGNSLSNEMIGNSFTKTGLPPYSTSNAYYGILLDAVRDFNVVGSSFSNFTYACYVQNTSISTDPHCNIYGNEFENNFRSVTSRYNNYKLNVKCNTFRNPNSVAQMYWLNYNAIPNQGVCTNTSTPAGNLFFDPIPVEKDINNQTTAPNFTYAYHTNPGPNVIGDLLPVIYSGAGPVTLLGCTQTFSPSASCNGQYPILAPSNSTRDQVDSELQNRNYIGAATILQDHRDQFSQQELTYYSILIPMWQKQLSPPQLSNNDLNILHEFALEDSSVIGANCRNIFTFFFKEEFERVLPEIISSTGDEGTTNQSGDAPVLYQNKPNPFLHQTEIKIYLPEKKGSLEIRNLNGQLVKQYDLSELINTITIKEEELGTGIYFYSLRVDGKIIDTKKMVTVN